MTTRPHVFGSGLYYIGDPCYAVADKDWLELCSNTGCFGFKTKDDNGNDVINWDDGFFWYKGQQCFAHDTAFGDGYYESNQGEGFGVDAGLIGILPMDVVDKENMDSAIRGGAFHSFQENFYVWEADGVFHFGKEIKIDTN